MARWWVGGYGPDMGGTADGIGMLSQRPDGSLEFAGIAASAASPSFLVTHRGHLYATLEGSAEVESFRIDGDSLRSDARVSSGGDHPCHLAVASDDLLVVANYTGGSLGIIGLADGAVSVLASLIPGEGSGPHPAQAGPHAHASFRVNESRLLSLDLGADRIHVHRITGTAVERTASVPVAPGTGPRDIVRHPSGPLYVLGEHGGELLVFEWADGGLVSVASVPLPGRLDGDQSAGLSIGGGGRFVYAGLRGSNRISVLRTSDDGRDLAPVGWVSTEGEWPRHHAVEGDLLHVANQLSNTVASFRLGADGMPALIAAPTPVPSPTYLLRMP